MDTSDSEGCFESADEEFYSGDEGDDTIEEVSVKEKDDNTTSKPVKPDEKKPATIPNSNAAKDDTGLDKMTECWEPGMNYDIQSKLSEDTKNKPDTKPRPEFGIPPARVECWFPEVNAKPTTANEENEASKIEHYPERTECSETGVDEKKFSPADPKPQPGYAIPPARVECWFPEVNAPATTANQENEPAKVEATSEYGAIPLIAECWEPGVNYPMEEYNKVHRPECNPPLIEECWEPGVNEPYYVEASEDGGRVALDDLVGSLEKVGLNDTKNNNASEKTGGDCLPVMHDSISKTNDETDNLQNLVLPNKDARENKTKVKVSFLEEDGESRCDNRSKDDNKNCAVEPSQKGDLWNEDDGWGCEENEGETCQSSHDSSKKLPIVPAKETILPDGKTSDVKPAKKTLLTNIKTSKADKTGNSNEEENMWGDDDDWEVKTEGKKVEEDLWEGDDWNVDSPAKAAPKKAAETKEDDLWGDDDNWLDGNQTSKDSKGEKDITRALDNLTQSNKDSSWGGWGNWGISSVLSTAANITSTVSQGITTVLETGIGVPDPEELARQHKAEEQSLPQSETGPVETQSSSTFGLTNLVSGVSTITKLVETTSTKVISGGLDTLETIGKKTMEVLQETDPGLKRGRAFLKIDQDKPVLSQILREAKEKAEEESKTQTHYVRKANYETIFDDHQGLVHLEALEMLSKQCEIKLESVMSKTSPSGLTDLQETLDQVKELCELLDEDEDEGVDVEEIKEKIEVAIEDIKVPITYAKLLERWGEMESWLSVLDVEKSEENQIHQYAIETLAELTAIAVEQYHKAGELLLIKEHRSTADEADSLVQLTTVITSLISGAATKFSEKLNTRASHSGNKDNINSLITNVFLESANSSRYLQDAFQLLIPVIQVGAV